MILKVRHAMKDKPPVVDAETSVTKAVRSMIQSGHEAIIVLDGDEIKGTVDLQNVLRYTYTEGFRPNQIPIGEITNPNVILARPNTSLEDALTIMTETDQYTLPVVDKELVGTVNMRDILKTQPQTRAAKTKPQIV